MFKSYLRVAVRSLRKHKLVSFINIFGLGLSMSLGLIIMIRLQDQLSYDTFHAHADRIYRVNTRYSKKTGEVWNMATSPIPLAKKIKADLSSVLNTVNIYPALTGKATVDGKEIQINGAFTGSSFFDVFNFTLAAGDPLTALDRPNSMVISKALATKFFGRANPLGRVVALDNGSSFVVTGVLDEPPGKSHLQFEAYAAESSVAAMELNKMLPLKSGDWSAYETYTYILLKNKGNRASINDDLKPVAAAVNRNDQQGVTAFVAQSLLAITPGKEELYRDLSSSSWTKLYVEFGIGFIILLAACFNYTNLTIARALTRAKEVGIRKVTGARRSQIFVQYVTESMLLAFFALAWAWALLSLIVEYAPFNDGYEFIPSSFRYNTNLVLCSIGFAVFTGLLAGVAPAWILSSFKPVRVLKNLSTAKIFGKVSVQKSLIVFQYSLSLTVIIFLFAFYQQFAYMAAADQGFKKDHVLVMALDGIDEDIATQRVAAAAGVRSVSALSTGFTPRFSGLQTPAWIGSKQDAVRVNYAFANPSFIHDMQFRFLAGGNFPGTGASGREQYAVINEAAARLFGFKDYNAAIGHPVWFQDSLQLLITGVLKDFKYENVGSPVKPLAFRNKKGMHTHLYIVTDNSDKDVLISRIQNLLKPIAGLQTVTISSLQEILEKNNSQAATISLLGYIAFMVVAIATLGLTGLVIYTVEVRKKEISVRKILGAGSTQLVQMLSAGFIKLLFIAGIISVPIGYTLGRLFMQNFAERSDFGLGTALLCFLLLLAIGLSAIISQTYQAASANPVKDLRME